MTLDIHEIANGAEQYLHGLGATPEAFAQRFGEKACEEYAHALAQVIQMQMILKRKKYLEEN